MLFKSFFKMKKAFHYFFLISLFWIFIIVCFLKTNSFESDLRKTNTIAWTESTKSAESTKYSWIDFDERNYLRAGLVQPGEDPFNRNKFNQIISDHIPSNRNIPDTRNRRMGKNATEAHVDISKVYGSDSITVRTCQNWFSKFHSGDFSLIDKQRSIRKIEVDDNKIMVLIKSDRHITTREIDQGGKYIID